MTTKFALWLAAPTSIQQVPWQGEAETIHEAIKLAEREHPGMVVTQGTAL